VYAEDKMKMILKMVFHADSVKVQKMSVGRLVFAQCGEFEEITQIAGDVD
jgi:hypothetical protein